MSRTCRDFCCATTNHRGGAGTPAKKLSAVAQNNLPMTRNVLLISRGKRFWRSYALMQRIQNRKHRRVLGLSLRTSVPPCFPSSCLRKQKFTKMCKLDGEKWRPDKRAFCTERIYLSCCSAGTRRESEIRSQAPGHICIDHVITTPWAPGPTSEIA